MVPWRTSLPVDEVCRLTAGSVGKIWRARRRHSPPDVKKLMAELLLACKSYSLPDTLDEAMCAETFPEAMWDEASPSNAQPVDCCVISDEMHPREMRKLNPVQLTASQGFQHVWTDIEWTDFVIKLDENDVLQKAASPSKPYYWILWCQTLQHL